MGVLSKPVKSPVEYLFIWASFIIVALLLSAQTPLMTPATNAVQSWLSADDASEPAVLKPLTRGQLIHGVNQERLKAGVPPLALDARLNGGAQAKAMDMEARGYYDHADPDGRQGYTYAESATPECGAVSENLAGNVSAEAVVADWMASESHRSALLDPKYDLTGLGIVEHKTNSENYWYVVQHFCDPVTPKAQPQTASRAIVPYTTSPSYTLPPPSFSAPAPKPTTSSLYSSLMQEEPSWRQREQSARQARIQSCLARLGQAGAGNSSASQACYQIQ